MKKWKLGALALIFFLLLVSLFVVTSSDDSQEQNTNVASLAASSDDLVYTEVYTTTGSGSSAVTTLTSYAVSASNINISGSLVIPETYRDLPISGIFANGFKDCTKLTEITIPSKCVSIGTNAFANCTSLTKIYYNVLDNTSTTEWTAATTPWLNVGSEEGVVVVLGNAVTKIAPYQFAYFTNLKEVTGGPSLTSIGNYAFYDCINLVSYPYFDLLTHIGSYAFYNCSSLEYISVPSHVTSLGSYAFQECTVVKTVEYDAILSSCTLWTDATTPWLNVGSDVEGGIILVVGTRSLPYYAFHKLDHVSHVIAESASYSLVSSGLSSSATKVYPFAEVGSAEEYVILTIPDETVTIGNSAFYNFTELKKVEIGKGLTSIGTLAFGGCPDLEIVEYNAIGDKTKYSSYGDKNSPFFDAGTNGWILKIGSSVDLIPQYLFRYSTNLKEIDVSDASSLREIMYYAFGNCTSLKSITIPESIETLGNYSFYGCTAVEHIYFNAASTNEASSGYNWFYDTGAVSGLTVHVGESVQSLSKYVFSRVINLSTVYYNVDTNVVKIFTASDNPFCNVGTLNSEGFNLIIGDNVTQIPRYAFFGAISLKSVSLTPNVESICSNAFKGCSMLTDVSVAKNTKIESNAFEDNLVLSYVDTVTVHFNSNGGSDLKDKYLLVGNKLVKPEDPVREGYNFAGWYTNLSLTKEYNFDNPVTENITLYADWSNVNDDPVTDDPINNEKETNYTWILWVIVILIALYLIFGGRK